MGSGKTKIRSSKKVKKTNAVGDPFYSPRQRLTEDQQIGFNLDRLSGG